MAARRKGWQVAVAGLLVTGGLGVATLAADELPGACRTEPRTIPSADCRLLTAWTMRLAEAQLAQYPPGYSMPHGGTF